jgi:hypothetical protein
MKQREFKKCSLCKKAMMIGGNITFYKISMERFIVNLPAVKRQYGLELELGSGSLAAVMGPDEDLAQSLEKIENTFVCESCAMDSTCMAMIFEQIAEENHDKNRIKENETPDKPENGRDKGGNESLAESN